jgi:DNA repair protein RadC
MKITDLPLHQRPREKLLEKGVSGLRNAELLALMIRTGVKGKNVIELSETIIANLGNEKLLDATFESLLRIGGIDRGKASVIVAAFELARRLMNKEETKLSSISSPEDVFDQCADIRNLKKEHFVGLYLDARNRLLHKETISVGIVNASIVHPREVFEPALIHHAVAIIVVHNHPSGTLDPSREDILITRKLVGSGELLGIEVADHIIVGQRGYLSMKEERLW